MEEVRYRLVETMTKDDLQLYRIEKDGVMRRLLDGKWNKHVN